MVMDGITNNQEAACSTNVVPCQLMMRDVKQCHK